MQYTKGTLRRAGPEPVGRFEGFGLGPLLYIAIEGPRILS